MKLHPHNGTVLCKMTNQKEHLEANNGIVYNKTELPIYEIVEIGDLTVCNDLKAGDRIISNSEPTRLKVECDVFWLIKQEYIAGKVEQ